MTFTISASTIAALKAIFSRHGVPEVVRSDDGSHYNTQEFAISSQSFSFIPLCIPRVIVRQRE